MYTQRPAFLTVVEAAALGMGSVLGHALRALQEACGTAACRDALLAAGYSLKEVQGIFLQRGIEPMLRSTDISETVVDHLLDAVESAGHRCCVRNIPEDKVPQILKEVEAAADDGVAVARNYYGPMPTVEISGTIYGAPFHLEIYSTKQEVRA